MRHVTCLTGFAIAIMMLSAAANGQACGSYEKFIKTSLKYCVSESREKTFILLDGSDGFSGRSKEWVQQNIFNNKKIIWSKEGSEITVARLGSKSVADMDMVKICTPKHESQIDFWDAPGKVKRDNALVHCSLSNVADEFLSDPTQANRSSLVEAVAEVFKNPRYNFSNSEAQGVGRKFFFISDLFQNSRNISFHKLCKVDISMDMLRCPSFDDLVSENVKVKRYLSEAIPRLNKLDEIHIYNINVSNRIDQSARDFWEEYFVEAGADITNIFYRAELDG